MLRAFLKNDNNDAFDEIVRRKYGFVLSVCNQKMRNEPVAQDCAQAVFITLASKRSQIRPDCILSTWLYRTALFACENALKIERRNQRKIWKAEEAMKLSVSGQSHSSFEISEHLGAAIQSLSESDRIVIFMRYADDLSLSEISDALRISAPAASQRISRALEKLRRFFAKNGDELAVDALSGMLTAPNGAPDINVALGQIHAAIGQVGSSAHAIEISRGVIYQMKILKLKLAAAVILGGAAIVAGAGYAAFASPRSAVPVPQSHAAVAPWPSKEKPTAAFLLAAWEKADRDAQSRLPSYQLVTSATVNETINGKPGQDGDDSAVWRHNGSLWYLEGEINTFTAKDNSSNRNTLKESFDGSRYYHHDTNIDPPMPNNARMIHEFIQIKNNDNKNNSDDWHRFVVWPPHAQYLYAEDFNAWILQAETSGDRYLSKVKPESLLETYRKQADKLTVSDPEIVAGRTCYALNIGTAPDEHAAIPTKIDFAYIDSKTLAPIRQTTDIPGKLNLVFTYTDFSVYGGKYLLPSQWTVQVNYHEKTMGLIDMQMTEQLKWSRINDKYSASDFQVKFPPHVTPQQVP
jgi:RNA polymerase sigma factor (sigma-70 family)